MNNKQLLRKVVEIPVPSHQTFDTRKECHAGYEGKGKKELKVTWFQPLLKEHYLGLEFVFDADLKKKVNRELPTWLVELNVPKKTIVIAKLLREARDPEIIAAINNGGRNRHIIHFAHYFDLLNRHPNGEYRRGKGLRVNHFDNIGFCRDRDAIVRTVSSDFFDPGWSIATDPVQRRVKNEQSEIERRGSWRVGDYVLYYKD